MSKNHYSESFKANVVQQYWLTEPHSITKCANKFGIAYATLQIWLQKESLRKRENMKQKRTWSAQEKLRILFQSENLSEEESGAFLRKNGIYEATLQEWKQDCLESLGQPNKGQKRENQKLKTKVQKLEKEVNRKDKALAESAALLVLSKKFQALWVDEEDDT